MDIKTKEEIERALEILDSESGRLDWKADNFKYGFLLGKVLALEWVLGTAPGSDLARHLDFEDWCHELKESAEDLRRMLKENPHEESES